VHRASLQIFIHPPSFNSLRHTADTLIGEAGIPTAVVMEIVGHDSKQMSEHCIHVGQEAMKKAA
jgi:integrase